MKAKCILICLFYLFRIKLFGHEQLVHQEITAKAEAVAYAKSTAYANFFNAISSDRSRLPQSGQNGEVFWLVYGSYHEDDAGEDAGGKRSYNHFYDPLDASTTYGKGLSDAPQDIRTKIGLDSFTWASTFDCPGWNYGGFLGLAEMFKPLAKLFRAA